MSIPKERDPATWLDYIHSGQAGIRQSASHLRNLKHRLSGVGFTQLAKECGYLVKVLEYAEKEIADGTNMSLTEAIERSHQGSANMLRACLAGAALNSKDPDERKTLAAVVNAVPNQEFEKVEQAPLRPRPRFGDECE